MFQSTHLHEVWQGIAELFRCSYSVSIHTPTWGVTLMFTLESSKAICFNPHTYMRCDLEKRREMRYYGVSIHTPTWGVTLFVWQLGFLRLSFNPHTYMRCDTASWLMSYHHSSFNPHTYMRCDAITRSNRKVRYCFNPHTYMRCDNLLRTKLKDLEVSIHTPTWGVTTPYKR